MIKACALASGSNGNSYFIKTKNNAFLVDTGISSKQILLRLEKIGHSMNEVSAIFISHEHSDHIRGLEVLSKKHPTPIYLTKDTYENSKLNINPSLINFIQADDIVNIGNTKILSFSKCHDAIDPCSYVFEHDGKKISVITDIGIACNNVTKHVKNSNMIFLETNYDDQMLTNSFYPQHLKNRISGNNGHLSNYHAGLLILEHASPELKYLFLSHLSENNNNPDAAMETFHSVIHQRKDLQKLKTIITSRNDVSEIIEF